MDPFGKLAGEVPLPTRGAVVSGSILQPILDLLPKGHPDKFIFAFSSLTVSAAIYSHAPGCPDLEMLQAPQAQLDGAVVEERWAISTDGTRVPYHLVRRADVSSSEPQPTLICAYGGFNAPLVPQFPGPLAAFIAFGGVYVHAHLRGGGEFGLDWWRGGRMATKQNCYQDLYAVAEDLIESGRTTQKLLAVTGESNGGLMAGVAVTQRPDLWAVVVPRVPLLDLIGACRDSYGRMAVMMDLANVEEPDEVRRLATFSPYNLVREGTRYPAVFIDAGNNDPRCPPWHARKFAARLQNATAGNAPIVLQVWDNAGHGAATDRKLVVAEYVEWLAFTLRHLGLGGGSEGGFWTRTMSISDSNALYGQSIVVDATAPLSPFSAVQTELGTDALVSSYAAAGVTLAVFTIVDDFPNSIEQTLRLIGANRRYFSLHPERFVLADRTDDVAAAKEQGKLAVSFAFQGSNALMGDLTLVEVYRRLGVVQMLLAYNAGNLAADGCHESRNAGLTQFGRDLVAEMNRVGMIVDVTHVGRRSSLEALELTTRPPLFSHSTPQKFAPHDRNITDEQIRACAAKGGVVCLNGIGLFMDATQRRASASLLADTIEYVVQLVGPGHAGIGLDYIFDTESIASYFRTNMPLYGGGRDRKSVV